VIAVLKNNNAEGVEVEGTARDGHAMGGSSGEAKAKLKVIYLLE